MCAVVAWLEQPFCLNPIIVVTEPKNLRLQWENIFFFLSLTLSISSLHIGHHNNMYCHCTMYCQKAFVQVCVHTLLLITSWCWVPGKSLSLFSASSFLFVISAIWFKWTYLQLASLQLFQSSCRNSWTAALYTEGTLILISSSLFAWKVFLRCAGKLSLSYTGGGLHH